MTSSSIHIDKQTNSGGASKTKVSKDKKDESLGIIANLSEVEIKDNKNAVSVNSGTSNKGNVSIKDELKKEWDISLGDCNPVDSLLDSLVIVSKLLKKNCSPQHICQGLPLVNGFLTVSLFQKAAQRCGLSARLSKVKLKEILSLTSPAILLLKDHKACVLVGINKKRGIARVIYPETGEGTAEVNIKALNSIFSGYAFFTRVQYQFNRVSDAVSKSSFQSAGHWFWSTVSCSWKIYRDVLIASLLIHLFAIVTPLFVMNVYDRVIPNQSMDTLWVLALGVIIVFSFDLILRLVRNYFIDIAGKKSDLLISSSLFERIMSIDLSVRARSVGSFAKNIQDFENIRDFVTSSTISILIDIPFTLIILGFIYFLAGSTMVLPVLCAIGFIISYSFIIQFFLKYCVNRSAVASAEKNGLLIEALSGVETIKCIQAESALQLRWENAVAYISKWLVKSKNLSNSIIVVANTVQQLLIVSLVVLGAYGISAGNLTMGALIAVVMLSSRCVLPMMQVSNLIGRYHQAKSAFKTIDHIMKLPSEINTKREYIFRDKIKGSFAVQNVSFSYRDLISNDEITVLKNINLSIKSKEKIAILGRMGSGKSTLIKLLLGFYRPKTGRILVDEVDHRQISPADIRRNIGCLLQDSLLFQGSIRENIVMGVHYISEEALIQISEITGVMDFARLNPLGLDMQVGERGSYLSPGQKQAVVLARTLIKNPPVLLLDEPCDAMDGFSEIKIRRNIQNVAKDKTMVMVTHKASMLDIVDRIIVMDQGRIIADGPKQEIITAMQMGKINAAGA